MDSMFEKTIKGIAKKMQKNTTALGTVTPMEIDSGAGDPDVKARNKVSLSIELPPIINCERDFWRRTTTGNRRSEERPPGNKEAPDISRVDSWVST